MRRLGWWDLAAVAVTAVTVLITLREPPYGPEEWGTWIVLGAFLVFYAAYARWFIPGAGPGAPMGHFIVIAVVFAAIIGFGCGFEPAFAIMQTFIYPFLWFSSPGTRSAIAANLLIAVALAVGYAVLDGPGDIFSGVPTALFSVGFSIALGLWITRIAEHGEERGRLLDELQAAQGQLAVMHRDSGVLEERGRLAREIHDTIAQSLTGLVMVAQRAGNRLEPLEGEAAASAHSDVELIEQMAREALTEARGLVASLTPVESEAGLADALRRLATSFERETGVRVSVAADADALDRELEVVLLRCAQEGLANVRKHARAEHATIEIAAGPAEVVLVVRDDGVGPRGAVPGEGGFGVAGMRDRVALVGGEFAFGPGATGGTVLRVVVPRTDAGAPITAPPSTPTAKGSPT
ncbi:sensor histidine kinase [Agromyces sp. ISL-38]|uniref:sensor histidine kinase n=1 Tax=Agromyces sp. ISL-38 TaxID=2819107 RepID=UPI001BE68215|nr:sensor histidine kinase [Agromyces sp. ISL-38]MBT2500807.1 sensor histidine kinase [Agromyces sp. ISL-38]